ncbi:MAG: hypothetical protein U5L02_09405 [Rheinheimera sp.]|nr:hypothetical protein [Rheinheimera sp.]
MWQHTLDIARLKRLQLAAAAGQAELFLLRPAGQAQLSLPVGLSLALSPAAQGIEVRVLKTSWRLAGCPATGQFLRALATTGAAARPAAGTVWASPRSKHHCGCDLRPQAK